MALSAPNRNLHDYIEALEGERRKILMLSRELPLCLELITQAIEIRRRDMAGDEYSCELPVLEEFIPLKSSSSSSGSEKSHKAARNSMPDWLRSSQLYAPAIAVESSPVNSSKLRKPIAKVGGAFELFEKEKPCSPLAAEILESSTTMESISAQRKQRRYWSPELHRKFLCALEQLGGSQSATPKQIRELMKVERLTNDEVKSHLQKYRLHTRRLSTATIQSNSCISPQIPPQLVLVGGIWVPPPDYTVMVTTAEQSSAAFNGIYSSVPSMALDSGLPRKKHDKQQKQLNNLLSKTSHLYGDDNNLADHESEMISDSCTLSSFS